jgi:hAT family C-terminal dimerisation region
MGGGLDCAGKGSCSYGIRAVIQALESFKGKSRLRYCLFLFSDKLFTLQIANSSKASTPASTNIFDDLLEEPETTEIQDELEAFLGSGRDLKIKNGLRWWYEHAHLYPYLSRMAIDYLSIPGM